MSYGTSIEWANDTWTVAVGCTRVSAGCDHCYAATFAHRGLHATHKGLTKVRPRDAARPGVDWNGTVRPLPERLADPLKWRKPRRVFVGSMTDLFHPQIPFDYVAAVFGVMAACPQHTFLVLTKRPKRAREFFAWLTEHGNRRGETERYSACSHASNYLDARPTPYYRGPWPLPNVHLGTSVEGQPTADARIPELLQCPSALHWVSLEPLLGPVELNLFETSVCCDAVMQGGNWCCACDRFAKRRARPQWVVVGGESGPGARPFRLDWARSIIAQCRDAGVPVFVKQLGADPRENAARIEPGGAGTWHLHLRHRKGGDPSEWPEDLRCRELPRMIARVENIP